MIDDAKKDMKIHLDFLSSKRPARSLTLKLSTYFFKENIDCYDDGQCYYIYN